MPDEKVTPRDDKTRQQPPARTTEQRLADLELQLATARATTPLGTTPDHGAGVGSDIAETWSQYDQELARVGEHPDQEPEPEPAPTEPDKPESKAGAGVHKT